MLPRALAVLVLGALCSAAPAPAPALPNAPARPPRDLCPGVAVIQEVLVDVGSLAVDRSLTVPVDVRAKKCMRHHLKTFLDSLATLDGKIAQKLAKLHSCKELFTQEPDEECETAEVDNKSFKTKIEVFLLFLNEQL